jgi:hypothetical protein
MVLGGVIMSLYMLRNCVYGCGVYICLSGGFVSVDIVSSSWDVQSCGGGSCRYVLHISMDGLIVVINA